MENEQIPLFCVSDFVASVNQTLEYTYVAIAVEGEVANFKVSQGKWVFFDLKDNTSSIGCFMSLFQLRTPIEDGMKIVVRATPKLTTWGKFSLTVQSVRPSGEGSIKKSFLLLKKKLEQEGLFAQDRKRPLPTVPRHVAVISSIQAAGYADFIKILNERWGGLTVDVAHVQVQGTDAPEQIIQAITYFNAKEPLPDVLVVIRGGGSADDLAVFNDEPLVRAIATSRIPTLVGVGHEIDVTLADMAADVRAATPSNAAQILVPDKCELIGELHRAMGHIVTRMDVIIHGQQTAIREVLHKSIDMLDSRVDACQAQLLHQQQILAAYDPRLVMARGYAIVRGMISVGKRIEIEQTSMIISAEVIHVKHQ